MAEEIIEKMVVLKDVSYSKAKGMVENYLKKEIATCFLYFHAK